MDTLKRELYMRARTLLESRQTSYICWALMDALTELGISNCMGNVTRDLSLDDFPQDIFPEFFDLDDQRQWAETFGWVEEYPRPKGIHTVWWIGSNSRVARLRLLDCILNSH